MGRLSQQSSDLDGIPAATHCRNPAWDDRSILLGVVALGLLVRLAFLVLSGDLELWADEATYVQLGAVWSRFGFYMESPYVWPPLYPALLALCIDLFGEHGITAAKIGQVLLSGIEGASVVLLANRLFSRRAAFVGGLLWAGYLPLVAYTHFLWPETLFLSLLLPAVFLFITLLGPGPSPRWTALRLVVVGLLLGLAGLIKEAALPLPVLLSGILIGSDSASPLARRLTRGAILPLAAVTVLVPWTLRCREVYGRWIVGGATLGQNLFWGVNARYINFDYTEPARDRINKYGRRLWLIRLPSRFRWDQAADANLIDRSRGDVKRAMSFVIDHPGFYWRSRVKRLADWVTPLSFFDRHYRMNLYRGALNRPWIRRILVSLSVGATMMVLAGAVPGLLWTLAPPSRRVVIGAVILTFVSTVMVVSMSRYRVPVEPLMLVLTAGFVTDLSRRPPWRSARFTAVLTGWIVLALLWALNAEEVWVELSPLY